MSNLLLQKNRASKGNGSWKNYSKEKTAITFGEECRMGWSLSYLRKDFNHLFHINVEEWHEMYIYMFHVPSETYCMWRVKWHRYNHMIAKVPMEQLWRYINLI